MQHASSVGATSLMCMCSQHDCGARRPQRLRAPRPERDTPSYLALSTHHRGRMVFAPSNVQTGVGTGPGIHEKCFTAFLWFFFAARRAGMLQSSRMAVAAAAAKAARAPPSGARSSPYPNPDRTRKEARNPKGKKSRGKKSKGGCKIIIGIDLNSHATLCHLYL